MKAVIQIKRDTGEIDGITVVSYDPDRQHVQSSPTHDVMEIDPSHPVISQQQDWHAPRRIILGAAWHRELTRKADAPHPQP